MKTIAIVIVSLTCLLTPLLTKAQNPPNVKVPVKQITIDGDIKDWGDSLHCYNAENNVRYGFAADKDNLFFAVKIEDRTEAIRILKAGLTLGFDPKGKKKGAFSITFPLNTTSITPDLKIQPDNFAEITQADRDELAREMITSLRGIKVEGFKDIEGDMITTSNTYGIKTVIGYDEKGNLVCEAAIALKLLHLDDRSKSDWLYDIKVNGVTHPAEKHDGAGPGGEGGMSGGGMGGGRGGMGGGRGGMGGGRGGMGGGRGGDRSQATAASAGGILSKSVEFSGKLLFESGQ